MRDAQRPPAHTGPTIAHPGAPTDTPDRRLATRAAAAGGIVDLDDTDAAGLSRRAVSRRVSAGRLHRIHPGVYAVGHPGLDSRSRAIAALRAGGPTSVLSHRSAVALWGLGPWAERPHVTLQSPRRLAGVATHRARVMPRFVLREGMRTTLVPRTLLDLAEVAEETEVSRVLNEALYVRRTSTEALERFLEGCRGRRGVAVLRRLLPDAGARHSPLEDGFFALLRAARLPIPESNTRVAGHSVDFWWPEARVVVETDGRAAHGTRMRFETDRERDSDLLAVGIPVMRVTRHALKTRPYSVTARPGAVLLAPRQPSVGRPPG